MSKLITRIIAIGLTALAPLAYSQSNLSYIIAGNILDPVSGTTAQDQVLVIEGERISGVFESADIAIPQGATVIDLSGSTVLPGLIDAHVHLTSDASINGFNSLGRSAIRDALYGVKAANDTLQAGFTTVRNLGASGYGDVALREAIEAKELPGPRMFVSGPSLGITGGHCDNNLLPADLAYSAEGVADGPWALVAKVRTNNKYRVDVIKFCATGGVMSSNTNLDAQQFSDEEMAAIVNEAHTLGLKVAAHAHGTAGIKAAIRAGVDSVEHASYLDEEAISMALEKGTSFVMDVYVSDYILSEGEAVGMLEESLAKERVVGEIQRQSFREAVAAGVNIVFGSDAGVYTHGLNGNQFAYMVKYGMSPLQAIQAATFKAAALIGVESEIGSIAPGYYADLIAVEGDPLEDISLLENVNFVMKSGEVFKQ